MKRLILVMAGVALTASVGYGAYTVAPYTGETWTRTWDFNDGQQGFAMKGSTSGFWDSAYGGGSLAFSDTQWAELDLATLGGVWANLGSGSSRQGFIIQADVLFPPLAGQPTGSHPGVLQGHSLGLVRSVDGKGPAIGGGAGSSYGSQARDRSWDSTNRTLGYTFGLGGIPQSNTWMKVQLDYGYTTPGLWNAWVYNPLPNDRDAAGGWMQVALDRSTNANSEFNVLTIGGNGSNAQTPWGLSRFDNVRVLVPEPAMMSLLVLGGLLPVLRRRVA